MIIRFTDLTNFTFLDELSNILGHFGQEKKALRQLRVSLIPK